MRTKLFNTVLALVIVGPFAYFTFTQAVHIKQQLDDQHSQIKSLTTESAKLDKKLIEMHAVKDQTTNEVNQLEQQAQDALLERQKLEVELGAN